MDREAEFVQLITEAQRGLYAYILSLMVRPQEADDVLQEVNLVLWEKASDFERGTNFSAWACKIASFQVMAYRKRQHREHLIFSDDLLMQIAQTAAEENAALEEHRRALLNCMDKLPDAAREMLHERYSQGGSVQYMASRLGRSVGAISTTLYRIRATLLQCVQGVLGEAT